jgi:hypothetical protein
MLALLGQATATGVPLRMLLVDDHVIKAVELASHGREKGAAPSEDSAVPIERLKLESEGWERDPGADPRASSA